MEAQQPDWQTTWTGWYRTRLTCGLSTQLLSRMGLPKEKVMVNIQRYGNTTAGTLPLCLWDWEPQLKKGDNLILSAFGGGFTWGAVYLKWAYNS